MKKLEDFLAEVEGPRSSLDRLVRAIHKVKKTDYPLSPNSFEVKTTKDKTKKASYKDGEDVRQYRMANGQSPMREQLQAAIVDMFSEGLSPMAAKHLLDSHEGSGKDFFSLKSDTISSLHAHAKKAGYRGSNNGASLARNFHQHLVKKAASVSEGVENVQEVSQGRLKDYLAKSKASWNKARDDYDNPKKKAAANNTMGKRSMGIDDAKKRIKEENDIHEVSKERLKNYIKKAADDKEKSGYAKGVINKWYNKGYIANNKKIEKRTKGIAKAVDKMTEGYTVSKVAKEVPGEDKYHVFVDGKFYSSHPTENGAHKLGRKASGKK